MTSNSSNSTREILSTAGKYFAHSKFPLDVWHSLVALGINAKSVTKRGRRSGVRVRHRTSPLASTCSSRQNPAAGTLSNSPVSCRRVHAMTSPGHCQTDNLVITRNQSCIPVRVSLRFQTQHTRVDAPEVNCSSINSNLNLTSISRSKCLSSKIPSADCMHLIILNCRSVSNKTIAIADLITSRDVDIMAITESWLGTVIDKQILRELVPKGYSISHVPRASGCKGGGVALIFKNSIQLSKPRDISDHKFTQFELIHRQLELVNAHKCIDIFVVYRPPPSKKNCLSLTEFFEEWTEFLEALNSSPGEIIITGDFNFHVDNEINNPNARRFMHLVEVLGFKQHVIGPTHFAGHTLDLLLLRDCSTLLRGPVSIFDPCLVDRHGNNVGDHLAISARINIRRRPHEKKQVTSRSFSSIILADFKFDLSQALKGFRNLSCADSLLDLYTVSCKSVVDKHAPLSAKIVTIRPNTAWYTNVVREAKAVRRKLERLWRKTKLEIHRCMFKHQCKVVGKLIFDAKKNFYNKTIEESRDQGKLFKMASKLFGLKPYGDSTKNSNTSRTADQFNEFFVSKVVKLKAGILAPSTSGFHHDPLSFDMPFSGSTISQFFPATPSEIDMVIRQSSSSTCSLDPIPTCLLKQCLPELVPVITQILNSSLAQGKVPSLFKDALVTPLLKTGKSDHEVMDNFRPISQLQFLSKVLERVVANRVRLHLAENDLLDTYQSAYRYAHSTETALIRVHHDIMEALDSGSQVALVLLDLTAAFDMVDHQLLLRRLQYTYGLSGTVLNWFASYLDGRTQCVKLGSSSSSRISMEHGVPQGSVLGPLLYSLFFAPVGNICRNHRIQYHCYADDLQIYLSVNSSDDMESKICMIEECIKDLELWIACNGLKLNPDKTELIVFHSKHSPRFTVRAAGSLSTTAASPYIKNLGVYLDSSMSMTKHVDNIVRTCYLYIRNISRIRPYLSVKSCQSLVQAYVISRLDYCNSLLYSLPSRTISRLQRIQNNAARLIHRLNKRDHITESLITLHWLPVHLRSEFKILTTVFKILHGLAPTYLEDLVRPNNPVTRSLRSKSKKLLFVPQSNTSTYGNRMFSVVAAKLWNALPQNLRDETEFSMFKKLLKTFYFSVAYGD